jgi:hypothetical protein
MTGLVVLALACVGLGGLVLSRSDWPASRGARVSVAFLLGALALVVLLLLAARLGVPLRAATLGLSSIAAPLSLVGLWRLRRRAPWASPPWSPIERAAFAVWLLLLAAMLRNVAAVPMASVDGRTLWWLHARLIHAASAYPAPEHWDPGFPLPHPQYPPLVPVLEAAAAAFGAASEPVMRAVPLLFYLALGGLLLGELPRRDPRTGRGLALVVLLLPTLVFSEEGGADAGVSDTALATYVAAAALALGAGAGPLAGLLAAGAALTKNEGLVLGALLVATASSSATSLRGRLRAVLPVAVPFAAIMLPWLLLRATLPAGFDERYLERLTPDALSAGASRAPLVAWEMMRIAFLHPQRSGLFWWGVLGLWMLARRTRERSVNARWLVVPAYLEIVFVLYLVSPWQGVLQVQLSFERVLLHLVPLAVVALTTAARAGPSKR